MNKFPTELEKGWLVKQVEAIKKEAETWPAWMKLQAEIDYDSRRDAGLQNPP